MSTRSTKCVIEPPVVCLLIYRLWLSVWSSTSSAPIVQLSARHTGVYFSFRIMILKGWRSTRAWTTKDSTPASSTSMTSSRRSTRSLIPLSMTSMLYVHHSWRETGIIKSFSKLTCAGPLWLWQGVPQHTVRSRALPGEGAHRHASLHVLLAPPHLPALIESGMKNDALAWSTLN